MIETFWAVWCARLTWVTLAVSCFLEAHPWLRLPWRPL